jgi:hypothetical protein
MVEALTRVGRHNRGKMLEARTKFEDLLTYANHLGLYSQETATNGRMLGNFPQALSHLALICKLALPYSCSPLPSLLSLALFLALSAAAYNLDRDLSGLRTWETIWLFWIEKENDLCCPTEQRKEEGSSIFHILNKSPEIEKKKCGVQPSYKCYIPAASCVWFLYRQEYKEERKGGRVEEKN